MAMHKNFNNYFYLIKLIEIINFINANEWDGLEKKHKWARNTHNVLLLDFKSLSNVGYVGQPVVGPCRLRVMQGESQIVIVSFTA